MNIRNIIFATLILFAVSCTSNSSKDEHGHEHNAEGHGHPHDGETHGHHEQEEFTVEGDSLEHENDSMHVHEDGSKHHDH